MSFCLGVTSHTGLRTNEERDDVEGEGKGKGKGGDVSMFTIEGRVQEPKGITIIIIIIVIIYFLYFATVNKRRILFFLSKDGHECRA